MYSMIYCTSQKRINLLISNIYFLSCIIFINYTMQIYMYTNPQCQAAEVSQLPERGAGERRLVATLAQQHLDARV